MKKGNFTNNIFAFGRTLWLASLGAIVTIGNESRNVFKKVKPTTMKRSDAMKQMVKERVEIARSWGLGMFKGISEQFQKVRSVPFAQRMTGMMAN